MSETTLLLAYMRLWASFERVLERYNTTVFIGGEVDRVYRHIPANMSAVLDIADEELSTRVRDLCAQMTVIRNAHLVLDNWSDERDIYMRAFVTTNLKGWNNDFVNTLVPNLHRGLDQRCLAGATKAVKGIAVHQATALHMRVLLVLLLYRYLPGVLTGAESLAQLAMDGRLVISYDVTP